MTNLLRKIFGMKKEPELLSGCFDMNNVRPFFNSLGIDIESEFRRFPLARNGASAREYEEWFSDIKASLVSEDKIPFVMTTVITGLYTERAHKYHAPIGDGRIREYFPLPTEYSFRIEKSYFGIKTDLSEVRR